MSYPLSTPLGRFGIVTLEDGPHNCAASIPAGSMTNPLTGVPTIAVLAVLVDHVGGLVDHYRRSAGEWTLTSELSLEIAPGALHAIARAPDEPVGGRARPFGPKEGTVAFGVCEFTHRGAPVATGMVRSFYIGGGGHDPALPEGPHGPPPFDTLAERMAVRVAEGGGAAETLQQLQDPVLNNSMGMVHGGVSSVGCELVASAAMNAGREDQPLHTASVRVNFIRPFHSGPETRYAGTALRVGRRSGIAEGQAIGNDGAVAVIARVTAYVD